MLDFERTSRSTKLKRHQGNVNQARDNSSACILTKITTHNRGHQLTATENYLAATMT